MKLHLSTPADRNTVTGYGKGYVSVNQTRYEHSLIVLPERLITDWGSPHHSEPQALAYLATLGAELVLIGTGEQLRFPPASALRPLIDSHIGFEIMDTNAACRTYNILAAEMRNVAAALIL